MFRTLPSAIEVLAAEPAWMGKIWPESVSAIGRVHAAEAHVPGIRAVFLDRIPFAVFPGAAADRLDFAVVFDCWPLFLAAATATVTTTAAVATTTAITAASSIVVAESHS